MVSLVSRALSPSRRPAARSRAKASGAYGWDRFVALVAMLVDVTALAFGGLLIGFGFFDPKLLKAHGPVVVGGVGLALLLVAAAHLAVHAGMFAGRRWAFVVAALLAGYGLAVGSAGASGLMLLYAVLRLGRVFGPELR